nr:receptor-like protein EIX2 [Coffea arabica]
MDGSTHFSVFLLVAIILHCSSSKTVNATCYASEKQALMDFKKDLKDPHGRLSSWIHDVDCCKWEGVVCSNRSGRVIQLHLQSPDPEIYVVAEGDEFFWSLRSLRYLDLSGAGFQGMVPYQLGNLSSLRTLSIGGHRFDLQVDNLQWLAGLSNLEHLDMSGVDLSTASNWLEVINTIPSLVEIHLSSCQLDLSSHHLGRDTFVFHANFSSLTVLDLSRNFLGHLIPRWIFGLTALASLDLSENWFEGPLSRDLWNLTSLKYLDLSFNHLNGSLPNELIHLNNLISLNLQENHLNGPIPSTVGNCTKLKYLSLNDNALSGSIPSNLGKLSSLQLWNVSHNKLTGTLPKSLGQLFKLEELIIFDNLMEGVVSESHLDNLTALRYFDASGNSLTLKVSASWTPRVQFEVLGLSSWKLGPQFPTWIRSQKFLQYLNLSFTGILDTIPPWFFNSSLDIVDLSHNQIHGKSSIAILS